MPQQTPPLSEPLHADHADGQRMRILIVDDDEIAREVLEHSLVPTGHEIITARDGDQAWSIIESGKCRMVISDWVMPGTDGVTLCRRIRSAELSHYVYVILLTCWARELDIVEGLSAGADDFLLKPIDPAELRVRIHNARRVLNLEELAATQLALADRENRLRSIFSQSRDAILVVDPIRNAILDANPAACEMFERTKENLLALCASDLHAEQHESWQTLLEEIHEATHGTTLELQCRTATGELFPTEVSASTIEIDGKGCLLTILRDISDRKRTEQQLIQYTCSLEDANRELQQAKELLEKKNNRLRELYQLAHTFVDNVSHEFRTPLTVIKEYAELLAEGAVGDSLEEQRRFLSVIADRADDLNTMVDDMLDGSKLDAGMMGVVRRRRSVAGILEHVRPVLERKADGRNVSLEIEVPEHLPDVYVDEEKVGRILINLTINAIKFCGTPGEVRIRAEETPGEYGVTIRVTDNGPGIEPARQAELFQRFKQLGGQVRGSCKGFGLGLSIAKELVDLNLGEISLESEAGTGTTFAFRLPGDDPNGIAIRFLERLGAVLSEREPEVSVFRVVVEGATYSGNESAAPFHAASLRIPGDEEAEGDGMFQEAEECLDYLEHRLKRNDLMFRGSSHEGLILVPVSRFELDRLIERLREALREATRNRPAGPLPEVEFEVLGTWTIPTGRDAVLRCVKQQLTGRQSGSQCPQPV
jgi:PAS domain S-box-containing protein